MPLLNTTNISRRLTSFTTNCLAERDNCVASKQASIVYNREIVRAKARLVSFVVGCISGPMKPAGLSRFYSFPVLVHGLCCSIEKNKKKQNTNN